MPLQFLKVGPENEGMRFDACLAKLLPDEGSRCIAKKLIEAGHARLNEAVVRPRTKVTAGDDIALDIPQNVASPKEVIAEDIPLDIFYEDAHLFVINKPTGMTVHPAPGNYSGTLVNALLYHAEELSQTNNDDLRPGIVHRLDKGTSGLMIVAKDNITHARLARHFQQHKIKKQYIALVEGSVEFDEGVIEAPLGRHPFHHEKKTVRYGDTASRDAVTYYQVIKRHADATLIALFPKTGRTHQLRVHMQHLGHSILGDDKYGRRATFSRLALHAQSISFIHPITKQRLEVSAPPPVEFLARVGIALSAGTP